MQDRSLSSNIILILLAMLAILVAACDSKPTTCATQTKRRPSSARSQGGCREPTARPRRAWPRGKSSGEWLDAKHDKHIVWKWNRKDALKAVNELYAAGAKQVWVVDITKTDGGGEMASQFVTVLPTEKPAQEGLRLDRAMGEKCRDGR